jgi:predicted  nucleic acid-binding Zn-ribbon protein
MFNSIDLSGTFNQLASVAASFQNLDELQNDDNKKDDQSKNVKEQSYSSSSSACTEAVTTERGATENSTIASSSSSIQTTFGNFFTNSNLNTIPTDTSTTSIKLSPPEQPNISHDACNREIVRLQSELDKTQNRLDQSENDIKLQDTKHQKLIEKYKTKVKESKNTITSLQDEISLLSQRYEDKLNEIKNLQINQQIHTTPHDNSINTTTTTDNNDNISTSHSNDHSITITAPSTMLPESSTSISSSSSSATMTLLQDYEILQEKYYRFEHSFQNSKSDWESKESDFQDLLEQSNKDHMESQQRLNDTLSKKIEEYQNLLLQHQYDITTMQTEKSNLENISQENIHLIEKLKVEITEKDNSLQDTNHKMKLLTEKFRDFMTKYTSLKSQYEILEKSDEKAAEFGAALQNKVI